MAVTDTTLNHWKKDGPTGTNLPQQSDSVGTEFDDILRQMKAIIRQECLDATWIRPGIMVSTATEKRYTVARASSTKLTTDAPSSLFTYGRPLMVISSGVRSMFFVGQIAFDAGTGYGGGVTGLGTAVDLIAYTGASSFPTPVDEILLGAMTVNGPSTTNITRGKLDLPTSGLGPFTVTLERAMPNTNYYVVAQIRAPSSATPAATGELVPKVTERGTTYVKVARFDNPTGAVVHTLDVLCIGP